MGNDFSDKAAEIRELVAQLAGTQIRKRWVTVASVTLPALLMGATVVAFAQAVSEKQQQVSLLERQKSRLDGEISERSKAISDLEDRRLALEAKVVAGEQARNELVRKVVGNAPELLNLPHASWTKVAGTENYDVSLWLDGDAAAKAGVIGVRYDLDPLLFPKTAKLEPKAPGERVGFRSRSACRSRVTVVFRHDVSPDTPLGTETALSYDWCETWKR